MNNLTMTKDEAAQKRIKKLIDEWINIYLMSQVEI